MLEIGDSWYGRRSPRTPGVYAIILLALLLALPIAAIVMGQLHGNDACVGGNGMINVSYQMSLYIYGGVVIALVGLELLVDLTGILGGVLWQLKYLTNVFLFAWTIVEAIIFFDTVNGHCTSSDSIWQFGLALFILQVLSLGIRWKQITLE
jgi:hypothetical protein